MLLKVITHWWPSGGLSFHVLPPSSLMMLGIPGPGRVPLAAEKTHSRSFPAGSTMR